MIATGNLFADDTDYIMQKCFKLAGKTRGYFYITGGKTMSSEIKTIGVLTSGGDAPGMNAAIRAVVRKALTNNVKVKGIKRGYMGLLNEEIVDMQAYSVADIIQKGVRCARTAWKRSILPVTLPTERNSRNGRRRWRWQLAIRSITGAIWS